MRTINLDSMKTTSYDEMTGKVSITMTPYDFDAIPSNLYCFLFNDYHKGNGASSQWAYNRLVEDVVSVKNAVCVAQGDLHESIDCTDKRYSLKVHRGISSRIDAQRDDVIKDSEKIGYKTIAWLDGNHELTYSNIVTPMKDIAKHFNSVYAEGVMAKIIFPGFRICCWHGDGRINSRAGDRLQRATNTMIALKRNLRNLPADDCDIISCGHYHSLILHKPADNLLIYTNPNTLKLCHTYNTPGRIYIDKKKNIYRVPEEEKYYISCGSFLRGYMEGVMTYPERRGYQPTELGYTKIEIQNDKIKNVEMVKLM